MTIRDSQTVIRGACPHDCPDGCAWQVTVDNGKAISLLGDSDHPFTRGGLCAKVNNYLDDRVYSSERVLYPMRRIGPKGEGRFERVTWDEALDGIAARLKQIIAEDGPTAILPYSYLGTIGLIQKSAGDPFFARLGSTRLVRAICGGASGGGLTPTIGAGMGVLPEDVVHSRFIILWGTNTIVTNLHFWPLVRQAQKNGATVVVIDPLKTRTAEKADWHIRPLPGTDAALALGMMHVIVNESLYDADYVEQHTVGFDRLRKRLAEYPPERAAALTGLEADDIVRLAKAYAGSQPSLVRLLIGMEHHANGAMMYRAVSCLPALVGAWRHRGGGLFWATFDPFFQALDTAAVEMPHLEDQSIRAVNMVQLGQTLTSQELEPPIRSLFVYSSNPAAIAPNQNLVLEGLRRTDLFTVVHEHFLTDTARYADYVLPATTQVEQYDLMWAWGHTYLALNTPAIRPVGEAVSNTELFRRLATRMGYDEPCLHTSDEERIKAALVTEHPYLEGITYERLVQEGWAPLNMPDDYRPYADGKFPTPTGKCEFYAESLAQQGMDPLPAHVAPATSGNGSGKRYPLVLISAKSALHFLNSSYSGLPRHLRAEKEPKLSIHPADAEPRGVEDGDTVRVVNERGNVILRAMVGDKVRPGVVAMPHGWWASLSPGGSSANALTGDGLSDLGGGGDFYDTLVDVEKVSADDVHVPLAVTEDRESAAATR